MKKSFLLVAATIFMLSLAGNATAAKGGLVPSKNKITTAVRGIEYFDVINIKGDLNVEYFASRDGSSGVTLTLPDNLLEYVEITADQGVLTVKMKDYVAISGSYKVVVSAYSPTLKGVWIDGKGSVKIGPELKTKDFEVKLSSTGGLDMSKLTADNLFVRNTGKGCTKIKTATCKTAKIYITGPGNVEVSGRVNEAEYTVTGSGDIKARKLEAQNAVAHVAGSGDIQCHADKKLSAGVEGSGSIDYYGFPASLDITGKKGNVKQHK